MTAACYSLHNIFHELSVAEKMEIIRKDRKSIKSKLHKTGSGKIQRTESSNLKRYINMRKDPIGKKTNV